MRWTNWDARREVISLDPTTIEDILDGISAVGPGHRHRRRARSEIAAGLRERVDASGAGRPACRRSGRWRSSGATRRSPAATGFRAWSQAAGGVNLLSRARRAVAARDLGAGRRRRARGGRVHALRLLPGGGRGGGRGAVRAARVRRDAGRAGRATCSPWTRRRISPGPGRGSSTASRSWPGRSTPRRSPSPPPTASRASRRRADAQGRLDGLRRETTARRRLTWSPTRRARCKGAQSTARRRLPGSRQ